MGARWGSIRVAMYDIRQISDSYRSVGGVFDGIIVGGKSISFGTSPSSGGGSFFGISGVGFG
jgi:hypothetical protein